MKNLKVFLFFYILLGISVSYIYPQEIRFRNRDEGMADLLLKSQNKQSTADLDIPLMQGAKQTNVASVSEAEYIVDSGDEFVVKIDVKGPAFKIYKSTVTPDGYLITPDGPTVYIRDLPLKQAKILIVKTMLAGYKDSKVECYLSNIHPISVDILGAIPKSGKISLLSSYRLHDTFSFIEDLELISFRNVQIVRNKERHAYDVLKYRMTGDDSQNPYLMDQDIIYFPYKDSTANLISVEGAVGNDIEFQYKNGDLLKTAIQFAGGLLPLADSNRIELIRFQNQLSQFSKINLKFPNDSDFVLLPDDRIYIRPKFNYHLKEKITIKGAVRFPGEYAISDGKTKLTEIIIQAGGFKDNASLKNSKLFRFKQIREDKELKRLSKMYVEEMNDIEKSYFKLRKRENQNLISCNFEKLFINKQMDEDVVLRDEDEIIIPEDMQMVFISGGIIQPGNLSYEPGSNYLDYIKNAGGFNNRAKKGSVIIVKSKTGVWLEASDEINIEEGDVIFIPESEYINWYNVFKDVLSFSAQIVTIVVLTRSVL